MVFVEEVGTFINMAAKQSGKVAIKTRTFLKDNQVIEIDKPSS